ncbi:SDR family NAD(P)-dependent oxidoreductase [Burkholderia pyrrocinia]
MNKPTLPPGVDAFDALSNTEAASRPRCDVAIIGIAGRYPMADHLDAFWRNLAEGRDCVSRLPTGRWLDTHPQLSEFGEIWGGFLDDVDSFDALFFGITPREAAKLDPQERLFLQCAYAAIEDAGYTRGTLGRSARDGQNRVGVYAGAMYQEYQLYGVEASFARQATAVTGIAASIANRVSYFGGFNGPSLTLDTMCSSSITAIHLACQSLLSDECAAAIAGGVNVSIHPNKYLLLKENRFLAHNGRCRSFAHDGDGYIPGEGVGVVILKRLDRAMRDGDRIHAVIKASAINHGGDSKGYYVPNARQHTVLIRDAIERAGVDPRHIQYVEAHGTGTPVGDPIELQGLTDAFSAYTADRQFCAIGSVKSNIGHSESAAGVAALSKIVLQMRHAQLVPSLHADQINPALDFAASPFHLQRTLAPWPRAVDETGRERPRVASLSSYGAGGSNAHLIVAEPWPVPEAPACGGGRPPVVLLSAPSRAGLQARARQLLDFLRAEEVALTDCAYTLQVGREAFAYRLGFVANDVALAVACLEGFLGDEDGLPPEVLTGQVNASPGAPDAREDAASDDASRLLRAWIAGVEVDWAGWHGEGRPRRIGLPTYPFAGGRIWLKIDTRVTAAGPRWAAHPLLQRNDGDGRGFSSTFDGREGFLADHRVDGRSMLPAVAYLEMARAAFAALGNADRPTRLSDLTWMRPARIEADGDRLALRIAFEARPDGAEGFSIERIDSKGGGVCATGRIEHLADPSVESVDVPAFISARCDRAYDAEACYRRFDLLGLQYGDAHRVICALHAGTDHVVARLSAPDPDEAYWLHPSLADGAWQAIIGFYLGDGEQDWVPVPFSLSRADLHRRCRGDMWCVVTRANARDGKVFDIALRDADGVLCARFSGLAIRNFVRGRDAAATLASQRSTPETLSAKVDPPGLNVPLAVRWVPACWTPVTPPSAVVWQVGEDAGAAADLAASGTRVVPLPHAVLDSVEACAAWIDETGPVDEIMWIAPEADRDIVDMQRLGVLRLFRLTKALLAQGYLVKPLAFTIVTRGAQPVLDDAIDATHSAVHGLVGVLAKEMRAWRFRLVDLDAGRGWPAVSIRSLPFDADGEAWAWREDRWYRQQLLPCHQAQLAATPAFRRGGVYVIVGGAGGIGKVLTRYLIEVYDAQVAWLGRRGIADGVGVALADLADAGRPPTYWQVDAADAEALSRARDEIVARHGVVHGVVNSVIVLSDQGVMGMNEQKFMEVLDVKVASSVNVMRAFRDDALDFMLFFSSLAAYLKSPGQSNYAAGSVFQDVFAQQARQRARFPVKVINWGYWGEFGAGASAHYRRRMSAIGVASVLVADSMAAIEQLLRGPMAQMGFIRMQALDRLSIIPTMRIDEAVEISARHSPVSITVADALTRAARQLAGLLRVPEDGLAGRGPGGVPEARAQAESIGKMVDRRAAALAYMKGLVGRALEVPLDKLDETTPLVRYGVDSISAVYIINALNETFGNVDSTLLFDIQTIAELADHFYATQADAFPLEADAPDAAAAVRSDDGTVARECGMIAGAVPRDAVIANMKRLVSRVLEVPLGELDETTPLVRYGVDSISGVYITNALGEVFGAVDSTLLFDLQTVEELADHFLVYDSAGCAALCGETSPTLGVPLTERVAPAPAPALAGATDAAAPAPRPDERDGDIAIIGLSGRYPRAFDLDVFWSNLRDGVHCIDTIPPERWDWRAVHTDDPAALGRSYSRWGGFIEGHDEFDPDFFHISPAEAELMDPQERLFLQYAYACIEDAGHTSASLGEGGEVGVFVGVMNNDYPLAPRYWSVANRVSYTFDFHGPSMAVDTACSSSLTALHLAVEALRAGTCASALAGGVNLITDPSHLSSLSYMQMLSHGDACRAFGDGADGFVASEGVGVVLLKPLAAARRDGDHVHGVIKGSMIASGGRTSGYTVPSPRAQTSVIARALSRAGVDPDDIDYLEAHGTGTALGDPIEIKGLAGAFGARRSVAPPCVLGSVKSNIGHGESAAGIAGLSKILLQMRYGTFAPTLHAEPLNPRIDLGRTPFRLPTRAEPWTRRTVEHDGQVWTLPRMAGLSSFGAGGANAHVVIAEADWREAAAEPTGPHAIVLSAQGREPLRQRAAALLEFLRVRPPGEVRLDRLAFTLQVGREQLDERLGFVADSVSTVEARLAQLLEQAWSTLPWLATGSGPVRASRATATATPGDEASLRALVDAWADGAQVAWTDCHVRRPRRLSLPTYPFKRERYWLPESHDLRRLTAEAAGSRASAAVPARSVPDTPPVGRDSPAAPVFAYRETWTPRPLDAAPAQSATPAARVLCIVDSDAHADQLAPVVANGHPGSDVLFLVCGHDAQDRPDRIAVRSDDVRHYKAAFAAVRARWPNVDVCYHVLGACDLYYCERDHALLHGIQGLLAARLDVARLFLLARSSQARQYAQVESWIGYCRSLPMVLTESAAVLIACLDAASDQPLPLADWFARHVVPETRAAVPQSVLYRRGVRHVAEVDALTLPEAEPASHAGRTWLITGGAGALAGLIWRHLHARGANVVLTGRRAPDDELTRQLDASDHGACRVLYVQADVCDEVAMRSALKQAKARFGRIDGVIHAAGVAPATTVDGLDLDTHQRVLGPKVDGARVLARLAEREGWTWLVQFSSSSAVLGDFGACSYAVANRFQTAHSLAQAEGATRHIAINWPLWRDGGMGLDDSRDEAFYLANSGQAYLETDVGLTWFERILAAAPRQAIVLAGERNPLRRGVDAPREQEVPAHPGSGKVPVPLDEVGILALVLAAIEAQLKLPAERVRTELNWSELGFDSIRLATLGKVLSEQLGQRVTPATFFSNPSVDDLVRHFARGSKAAGAPVPASAVLADAPARAPEAAERADMARYAPIAVIGMSGRFPGAESIDALWRNWDEGASAIRSAASIDGPRARSAGFAGRPALYGAFIDGVEAFDPLFFELSPHEAQEIDPQQRLFLQTAWHAFEDAGYLGDAIHGSRCGVFVGAEESLYGEQVAQPRHIAANRNATLSARIAYALNLKGPNFGVTASCSSGLMAVHQACRALQHGECDIALAGAVSMMASPRELGSLADAISLATEPACRVFDDAATGLVPAEAVAAVVLKPLARALADGDRVIGVIRGSAVNYDGRTSGLLAPSSASQARLFEATLASAEVTGSEVQLVLAHSIGMRLGDPVEPEALAQVLGGPRASPCALTSTKPVYGHSFAASGLLDLLAMLMALRHRRQPALLGLRVTNAYVDFAAAGVEPVMRSRDWPAEPGRRRMGLISTTGINGSNACAIVEEAPAQSTPAALPAGVAQLVALSAPDPVRLVGQAAALRRALDASEPPRLEDVAFTLLVGRAQRESRVAWVVESLAELRAALDAFAAGETGGCHGDHPVLDPHARVAWPVTEDAAELRVVAERWAGGAHLDDARPRHGRRVALPPTIFLRTPYWIAHPVDAPRVVADGDDVRGFIAAFLVRQLGIAPEQIHADQPLRRYGMDSVLALKLGHALEQRFGVSLSMRAFHENPSLAALERQVRAGLDAVPVPISVSEQKAFADFQDEQVLAMLDRVAREEASLDDMREWLK